MGHMAQACNILVLAENVVKDLYGSEFSECLHRVLHMELSSFTQTLQNKVRKDRLMPYQTLCFMCAKLNRQVRDKSFHTKIASYYFINARCKSKIEAE